MTRADPGPDPADARPSEAELHAPVDMSPEAIDRRIRELAQLWRLGMSLRTGRWVDGVREGEGERAPD